MKGSDLRWVHARHVVPVPFMVAAGIEMCLNVYYVIGALSAGDSVALPGAIGRAIVMSVVILAVLQGRRHFRELFAGLEFLTAGGALFFTFLNVWERRLTFEPVAFGILVGYLILGTLAVTGSVPPGSERSVAPTELKQ